MFLIRLFVLSPEPPSGGIFMPRPMTQHQRAAIFGYESGSVAASMTDEQRRAFKRWLKERDEDCRCMTKAYRNPSAAKR